MNALSTEIAKLKQAVGILHVDDLSEISSLASNNLKAQLSDPNSAFAQDPQLALKATEVLSKINTSTIEAQRRVIDTLIRYNSQLDRPSVPADNLLPPEEPVAPEIENPGVSTFE